MAEKIWQQHLVHQAEGQPDLIYVDLHLVHEVTSPQAFDGLRLAGRGVRAFLCAKLNEAEVLADAGQNDILIANQVVGPAKAIWNSQGNALKTPRPSSRISGPDRDDRGEQAMTVDVPVVGAVLVLPAEVDDGAFAGGPSGCAVAHAVVGDGGGVEQTFR